MKTLSILNANGLSYKDFSCTSYRHLGYGVYRASVVNRATGARSTIYANALVNHSGRCLNRHSALAIAVGR